MSKKVQLSAGLREAESSFEAGDVLAARHLADQLLRQNPSPEEAAAARELVARSRPDRTAWGYALLCAAIAVFLIFIAVVRTRAP